MGRYPCLLLIIPLLRSSESSCILLDFALYIFFRKLRTFFWMIVLNVWRIDWKIRLLRLNCCNLISLVIKRYRFNLERRMPAIVIALFFRQWCTSISFLWKWVLDGWLFATTLHIFIFLVVLLLHFWKFINRLRKA